MIINENMIIAKEKKNLPSCFRDEVYQSIYTYMSSIKLVNSMFYTVVWLYQSSKLSLRYMYIYMGKSKL